MNQTSNIDNFQIPVQQVYNQIETLAREDHFKQDLKKSCEFEMFQNSLGIKSMEGKVQIKIFKQSLQDNKVLFKKNLSLNFASETDLAHFRMRITSPVCIRFELKSAQVAVKKEPKPAPGEIKEFEEGKAVILLQKFEIVNGQVKKSKVTMLQQTPFATMLQQIPIGPVKLNLEKPKYPTFLYLSVGLIEIQKWTTINLGQQKSD